MTAPQPASHRAPASMASDAVTPLCDLLILVEDPGAANYVAGLPAALAADGLTARLFATGYAAEHLRGLGVTYEVAGSEATPAELLDTLRPGLLVVGTSEDPDARGLALIDTARVRGIASVGVIDGAANPALRFRGRSAAATAHAPDWLLVADQATRSAYSACGFDPTHIRVCGHPHFDAVRATRATLDGADRGAQRARLFPGIAAQPAILFLSEVSDGLDATLFRRRDDYLLAGNIAHDRRTQIVLDEFIVACAAARPDAFTILRLHPKDRRIDYADYTGHFDLVSEGGPVAPLLHAADLVVGMTSIALIEAALLGRPTLSILPRPSEAEWLTTIVSGVTPMVCRRSDIAPALRALIGAQVNDDHIDTLMPPGSNEHVRAVLRDLLAGHVPS